MGYAPAPAPAPPPARRAASAAKFNLTAGDTAEQLGFFAFGGPIVDDHLPYYGYYGVLGSGGDAGFMPGGTDGSGPVVLFNRDLSTSFVLSSARCGGVPSWFRGVCMFEHLPTRLPMVCVWWWWVGGGLVSVPTCGFPTYRWSSLVVRKRSRCPCVWRPSRAEASNFMTHAQMYDNVTNTLSLGVLGSVTAVPAQYSLETILYLGSGVNAAMEGWGSTLLARYGKDRGFKNRDITVSA